MSRIPIVFSGCAEVVGLYSALGHCNNHYYGVCPLYSFTSTSMVHLMILIPVCPLSFTFSNAKYQLKSALGPRPAPSGGHDVRTILSLHVCRACSRLIDGTQY